MADINHVVLVGRLTRDAELKYTSSGQAVCKFSIAVNRARKNGDQWVDEANFFDIVLWGRQGEAISKYLIKGKSVGVDGELRQDRWQQDGQNRSKVEIVAGNVQLLGGNPGASGGEGGSFGGGAYSSSSQNRSDSMSHDGTSHDSSSHDGTSSGGEAPAGDDHFADDIPF
jgi:single-strand DNA-binding protein